MKIKTRQPKYTKLCPSYCTYTSFIVMTYTAAPGPAFTETAAVCMEPAALGLPAAPTPAAFAKPIVSYNNTTLVSTVELHQAALYFVLLTYSQLC